MTTEAGLFKAKHENQVGGIFCDIIISKSLEVILHDVRTNDKLHIVGQLQPVSQPDEEILGLPQPKPTQTIDKRLGE